MFHVKHIYVKNAEASLILKKMTLNLKNVRGKMFHVKHYMYQLINNLKRNLLILVDRIKNGLGDINSICGARKRLPI